jgi:SelR domain
VPNGSCGLASTGISRPVPFALGVRPVAGADHEAATGAGLTPVASNDAEWRARLTPEHDKVPREAGTERPFTGAHVDTEEDGLYGLMARGNPLFDGATKFHSGWPGFTEAISPDAVEPIEDRSFGSVSHGTANTAIVTMSSNPCRTAGPVRGSRRSAKQMRKPVPASGSMEGHRNNGTTGHARSLPAARPLANPLRQMRSPWDRGSSR